MSNKYRNIVFDWDGCLADTIPYWVRFFSLQLKELGVNWSKSEVAKVMLSEGAVWEKVGVTKEQFFASDEKVSAQYDLDSDLINATLNPGVKETLHKLVDSGRQLSIVTGSNLQKLIMPTLIKEEIKDCFVSLIGKYDVVNYKPHPEGVLKFMEKVRGTTEDTIVVGDSDKDLRMAKNAGLGCVIYFPSDRGEYYDLKYLESFQPIKIIHDFHELASLD